MVTFKTVKRLNPQDFEEAPKFYPAIVYTGEVTFKDLAGEISDASTLNAIDCRAALLALERFMERHLQNGRIIRFGDMGSFRLSISGSGAETPEECTKYNITKARILFRPSLHLRNSLQTVNYRKDKTEG